MKKPIVLSIVTLIILLVVAVGFGGFSYFNKRLIDSKQIKELGELSKESGLPFLSSEAPKDMGAVETGLPLQIISPSNNSTVTSPSITLRGKTIAGAEVFVNDIETVSDGAGNFSVGMTLDEGENSIIVVANDASGTVGEAEITVTYEVEE